MNKYLRNQEEAMESLLKQANEEQDPRHQAMLKNFLRHMSLEISGRWTEFVDDTDTMMAENPEYHVQLGTPTSQQFDGISGVKEFYSTIDASVWMLQSLKCAVADWGIAAQIYNTQLMDGKDILAAGMDIGIEVDPETTYAIEDIKIAMFWPYDEKCRLLGEDVYQLEPPLNVTECAPENRTTKKDIERSLERFFHP
jgi:hypothetical protein